MKPTILLIYAFAKSKAINTLPQAGIAIYKPNTIGLSGVKMSKKFACKDIGMDCGFEAQASNEDALMKKVANHARKAHNITSIDAPLAAKVKAAIKEA